MSSEHEQIKFRMMKSGDLSEEWPVVHAWINEYEIIFPEQEHMPLPSDEESHNCDAMGCGQMHVMLRFTREEP